MRNIINKINNLREISNLQDYSLLDFPVEKQKLKERVYGGYHVFCVNDWETMVKDQVSSIMRSGLYDITSCIYVSVIAPDLHDIEKLKDILPSKFRIIIENADAQLYEMPILSYLGEKAKCEDFLLFYFHTKGVTVNSRTRDLQKSCHPILFDYSVSFIKDCNEKWRKLMEYFIFDKYNVAINSLYHGYNVYGAIPRIITDNIPIVSGNFWWSSSFYLKKLTDINKLPYERWNAEFWLGTNSEYKMFAPYKSLFNLYLIPIPEYLYQKRRMKISEIIPVLRSYYIHFKLIILDFIARKRNLI